MTKKRQVQRNKTNPFLMDLTIPVGGKPVAIGNLEKTIGKNNEVSIIDKVSGEDLGTSVSVFRKVDKEQFVKIFSKNIGHMLNLTAAGNKAIVMVIWTVQNGINKDKVTLDKYQLEHFLNYHKTTKMSTQTLLRGLRELVNNKILAMAERPGEYWINPDFCFSGNRITFIESLIREGAVDIPKQREVGFTPKVPMRINNDEIEKLEQDSKVELVEKTDERCDDTTDMFEVDNFLKND